MGRSVFYLSFSGRPQCSELVGGRGKIKIKNKNIQGARGREGVRVEVRIAAHKRWQRITQVRNTLTRPQLG